MKKAGPLFSRWRGGGALLICAGLGCFAGAWSFAEDWPTYQHDNLRSGVTKETLKLPLTQAWVHNSHAPPRPAWAGPAKWDAYRSMKGLKSMRNFDPVFHVTAVGDAIWFGSSADDSVHCLDATTGAERWSFCTDGPVRVPPSWHNGRVYFGSDDGCAYCVNADTGSLVWKYKVADRDRLIPNNGKLISLWPCRTGVLVQDGKAYFAASLLPWQHSYLCAVDAETGTHAGQGLFKLTTTKMTMQGPMLASATNLYALQGRSSPLVFRRSDGRYTGTIRHSHSGGVYAVLTEDSHLVFGHGSHTGWLSLHKGTPNDRIAMVKGANRIVISGAIAYLHQGSDLTALDRPRYFTLQRHKAELLARRASIKERLKKLGKEVAPEDAKKMANEIKALQAKIARADQSISECFRWRAACAYPHSLILAGDVLFAGGNGKVAAISVVDGRELWSASVQGEAHGLAVANGRLFVSTDMGAIYCFAGG